MLKTTFQLTISHCHGILFCSASESGFLISGTSGTGILMDHDPVKNTWSAPVSVSLRGVGVGIVIGHETKDMIVFLNSPAMIEKLATNVQLQLGSQVHRKHERDHTLHASGKGFSHTTAAFTYTEGRFFGASLEAAIVKTNAKRHLGFYGHAIVPKQILKRHNNRRCNFRSGVSQLHERLAQMANGSDEPRTFVPSQSWAALQNATTVEYAV